MKDLTITLTVNEANTVLKHLGKGAFDEVSALIVKIQTQAQPQLVEAPKAEENASTEK